ncbi:ABC transporter permease [Gorillibacterium sp. CAU 1737]|uniref:ABC transporter permease n=1 Tax=Gorillibacterium sp. CAU 1737 TaxID=3140362 RepID=UPI00326186A8
MALSMRHIRAIFKKECKEFGKNPNILFMCALPLLFAVLYSSIFDENFPKGDLLTLCVGTSLTMVTCFVIAMLIAEEKEKQTLRTLMLSAVSPVEFFVGKGLFTLLVSTVLNAIIFFLVGIDASLYGIFLLLTTLVCLTMLELGAMIGMIAQNQMATGVVGMPIVLVFFMVPMFAELNPVMTKIAWFLPNYHMNVLMKQAIDGTAFGSDGLLRVGAIVLWILVGAGLFAVVYRRNGIDR